jgi:hypothetical protein
VYGAGNLNTAEFWEYDTRLGRRWNVDPKYNASESRYLVNGNNPNYFNDPNGDYKTKVGAWLAAAWQKIKGNEIGKIYKNDKGQYGFAVDKGDGRGFVHSLGNKKSRGVVYGGGDNFGDRLPEGHKKGTQLIGNLSGGSSLMAEKIDEDKNKMYIDMAWLKNFFNEIGKANNKLQKWFKNAEIVPTPPIEEVDKMKEKMESIEKNKKITVQDVKDIKEMYDNQNKEIMGVDVYENTNKPIRVPKDTSYIDKDGNQVLDMIMVPNKSK